MFLNDKFLLIFSQLFFYFANIKDYSCFLVENLLFYNFTSKIGVTSILLISKRNLQNQKGKIKKSIFKWFVKYLLWSPEIFAQINS